MSDWIKFAMRYALMLGMALAAVVPALAQRSEAAEPKIIRPSESKYKGAKVIPAERIQNKESRLANKRARADSRGLLRAERREQRRMARQEARAARAALVDSESSSPQVRAVKPRVNPATMEETQRLVVQSASGIDAPVYSVYEGSPNPVVVEKVAKEKRVKEKKK